MPHECTSITNLFNGFNRLEKAAAFFMVINTAAFVYRVEEAATRPPGSETSTCYLWAHTLDLTLAAGNFLIGLQATRLAHKAQANGCNKAYVFTIFYTVTELLFTTDSIFGFFKGNHCDPIAKYLAMILPQADGIFGTMAALSITLEVIRSGSEATIILGAILTSRKTRTAESSGRQGLLEQEQEQEQSGFSSIAQQRTIL